MKDSADFNWEARRTVEMAQHFTSQRSCLKCHENLFPLTLTKEGQEAHLYYTQNEDELLCLNCHIDVGHYDPNRIHDRNVGFGSTTVANADVFTVPARVSALETFTETVPGTTVSFKMVAIPGAFSGWGVPKMNRCGSPMKVLPQTWKSLPFSWPRPR